MEFIVVGGLVVRVESFEDAHGDAREDEESGGFGHCCFRRVVALTVASTLLAGELVESLAHQGLDLGFKVQRQANRRRPTRDICGSPSEFEIKFVKNKYKY